MSGLESVATGGTLATLLNGLADRIIRTIETVKIREKGTEYHQVIIHQIESTDTALNLNAAPHWEYRPNENRNIRLAGIEVIWDSAVSTTHRPRIEVRVNNAPIVITESAGTKNPFENLDLNITFGTGKVIRPNDLIRFYVWHEGAAGTARASIVLRLGED